MADPDPAPLRRRFVTRADAEDAHREGQSLTLGPTDVITHEAAQRAADLGVVVTRAQRPPIPAPTSTSLPPLVAEPVATVAAHEDDDGLRDAVRAAVVAELGVEPPGLDAAIDAVLARHRR